MEENVVVIGAGNGGLTAAARLARDGVPVLLLERHNVPGGCATSFCRGRFEFEVALHQLSGLGTPEKPGPLRRQLDGLGVLDKLEFVYSEDLYRLQLLPDRLDITLRPDRSEVIAELQRHFPHEKEAIEKYFELIYSFFSEAVGAYYLKDPEADRGKYPLYFTYGLKSVQEVMDEFFSDPMLKFALSPYWGYIGLPPRLMSFHYMAAMLFGFIEFKPYHLKGGSQALSNALADTIISNGGVIRYNCGVKKIIVADGRVRGVITEDDDEIPAQFVISNASKISTFIELMDREHVPDTVIAELRQSSVAQSGFVIFMGLDCEPEEVGFTESTNFIMGTIDINRSYEKMKSLDIDENDTMVLSCYDFRDPSFSPEGASQVAVVTLKYGDPWLSIPPRRYVREKYRVAEDMLSVVEQAYPGLRKHIEEFEVATPLTFMRYLGHPRGSIYGFDHFIKDSDLLMPNKPCIQGLYGAGGWFGLCGFQPTLDSGVHAARAVLEEIRG